MMGDKDGYSVEYDAEIDTMYFRQWGRFLCIVEPTLDLDGPIAINDFIKSWEAGEFSRKQLVDDLQDLFKMTAPTAERVADMAIAAARLEEG
jgi:hypothetical protein